MGDELTEDKSNMADEGSEAWPSYKNKNILQHFPIFFIWYYMLSNGTSTNLCSKQMENLGF